MFIKIHKSYRNVVAIADAELIGKKFEEGKFQLNVTERFYKGDNVSKEQALQILRKQALEDSTFNIVGEKAIQASIEAGIIKKDDVAHLKKIPFALVLI